MSLIRAVSSVPLLRSLVSASARGNVAPASLLPSSSGLRLVSLFSTDTKADTAVKSSETASGSAVTAASSSGTGSTSTTGHAGKHPEEDWTEVVHEATGQVYYWNQATGETTQIGEPKPQGGGYSGSGGGGAGSGGAGTAAPGQEDWDPRAEQPLADKTGTYAAAGAIIGAFLGWASQFV